MSWFEQLGNGLNSANKMYESVGKFQGAMKFRNTDEYIEKQRKLRAYSDRVETFYWISFLVNLAEILATIILCVTGNDILLRLLHI